VEARLPQVGLFSSQVEVGSWTGMFGEKLTLGTARFFKDPEAIW